METKCNRQLNVEVFTQRHSLAKNVGCFQRRLFVCGFVCLFINSQHDNFQTSKLRMMKLVWYVIVHKSRPSSNLGVIAPWVHAHPQNWQNVPFG